MLKKASLFIFLYSQSLFGVLEVLPTEYLVSYGSSDSKVQIVEFLSLSCPHCLESYESDFSQIREKLIDTGLVQWVFHPVPLEEVTAKSFSVLRHLDLNKKRAFLESMLEAASTSSYEELHDLIKGICERLEIEMEDRDLECFLKFLSVSGIDSSPLVAIDGVLRTDLRPSFEEINREVLRRVN